MDIESLCITAVAGIIAYFLKKTMDELKEIKSVSYSNREEISVMKVEFKSKDELMSEKLTHEIEKLNINLKNLTAQITKQNG